MVEFGCNTCQFESASTIPDMGRALIRSLLTLVWVPSWPYGLSWGFPVQNNEIWTSMSPSSEDFRDCWGQPHREVPVLGLVIRWVMIDYPHTCVWWLRVDLTDLSIVVETCDLCRVYNYSNSRVRGHGQFGEPYCSVIRCFLNELWLELWLWLDHSVVSNDI